MSLKDFEPRAPEAIQIMLVGFNESARRLFGIEFTYAEFGEILEEMLKQKKKKFLFERVDHMPGIDLKCLIDTLREAQGGNPKNVQKGPVSKSKK